MIDVHLACNDDAGNFAGELFRVEFHGPHGDILLALGFDPIDGLKPFAWREGCDDAGSVLMISGRNFRVAARRRWVGNVAWDATSCSLTQAVRLARYLMKNGFGVEEHVCADPWDRLAAEDEG